MLDQKKRQKYSQAVEALTQGEVPAKKIAQILFDKIESGEGK